MDQAKQSDPINEDRLARFARALDFAQRQVAATIERTPDYFPIYTVGGRWHHAGELWTDWTGGFFAGSMWKFFEQTGDATWRRSAEHYSRLLEHRQYDRNVHDLGFIFLNTYRPWYERSGEESLRQVLVQAGQTLSLRFMQAGQYLRSFIGPESLFIDIMMNVPLIFYAAQLGGDSELERIGLAHCRTTRDRLVRDDGSTAHEGVFDVATGKFLRQDTHQGWRPDSAWARGLAWSLYGFSQVYALTQQGEFLAVAERNADFWLKHLPADGIPYWDFSADLSQPLPWGPQKDSSAAAIAASGLLDLAKQTPSSERSSAYRQQALAMLDLLAEPDYLAIDTPAWEGVLKHGVYHTGKGLGVDESVMWGDFFLVEAICKIIDEAKAG
ncbi:MAG TPA: glycoside hydrolase family 88 protein [Pirellulales bacterium]|nr:glycoside hydrolase family 88 protein [Pirellulales bacterium]